MSVKVINADVMDGLRQLPDESVQMCCTSPPYWGLRQYIADGAPEKPYEIGLEKTPAEFVARLVAVFEEVRRVLRKDGVCFVNLGDSYAATIANGGQSDFSSSSLKRDGRAEDQRLRHIANGKENGRPQPKIRRDIGSLKPKDLVGIPWRVAFALQDAGWWLRQDIIWAKPNPMPESVTDRCTKAHEYIFMLTKSARYFWDAEAIAEKSIDPGVRVATAYTAAAVGSTSTTAYGANARETRNKRSVWTIATAPFPEAHFATFPPELPEICIKAGSKPGDTILDPFGGAGTTGLVADRLQRNAILIELNPTYADMARARVSKDRGALLELMEPSP